jgi:hypothetical protein
MPALTPAQLAGADRGLSRKLLNAGQCRCLPYHNGHETHLTRAFGKPEL